MLFLIVANSTADGNRFLQFRPFKSAFEFTFELRTRSQYNLIHWDIYLSEKTKNGHKA